MDDRSFTRKISSIKNRIQLAFSNSGNEGISIIAAIVSIAISLIVFAGLTQSKLNITKTGKTAKKVISYRNVEQLIIPKASKVIYKKFAEDCAGIKYVQNPSNIPLNVSKEIFTELFTDDPLKIVYVSKAMVNLKFSDDIALAPGSSGTTAQTAKASCATPYHVAKTGSGGVKQTKIYFCMQIGYGRRNIRLTNNPILDGNNNPTSTDQKIKKGWTFIEFSAEARNFTDNAPLTCQEFLDNRDRSGIVLMYTMHMYSPNDQKPYRSKSGLRYIGRGGL